MTGKEENKNEEIKEQEAGEQVEAVEEIPKMTFREKFVTWQIKNSVSALKYSFFIFLSVWLFSCSNESPRNAKSPEKKTYVDVTGFVKLKDGKPVEDFRLMIESINTPPFDDMSEDGLFENKEALTDKTGKFVFKNVFTGKDYNILLYYSDEKRVPGIYETTVYAKDVNLKDNGKTDEIIFVLNEAGFVEGNITDHEGMAIGSNKFVPFMSNEEKLKRKVSILALMNNSFTDGKVDNNGKYKVNGLQLGGEIEVIFSVNGIGKHIEIVKLNKENPSKKINVVMDFSEDNISVKGVLLSKKGEPLPFEELLVSSSKLKKLVSKQIRGIRVITDKNGEFLIYGLGDDEYKVQPNDYDFDKGSNIFKTKKGEISYLRLIALKD